MRPDAFPAEAGGALAAGESTSVLPIDLHTHTAASGHGTADTVADLAKAAAQKGMAYLGISDHGPATPGSCSASYFRGLKMAPRKRAGISVLYGAEANILDESGRLDLEDEILSGLDFVIASIHPPTYHSPAYEPVSLYDRVAAYEDGRPTAAHPVMKDRAAAIRCNTDAYIGAMRNPYVRILGHPDDVRYPVDVRALTEAAVRYGVILEVNEASLTPGGFRGDTKDILRTMLEECAARRHPVLLSSDSHGAAHVGEAPRGLALLEEIEFPRELVLNFGTVRALLAVKERHLT